MLFKKVLAKQKRGSSCMWNTENIRWKEKVESKIGGVILPNYG